MTHNQLTYQQNVEANRHNTATERETNRNNRRVEYETWRHNREMERLNQYSTKQNAINSQYSTSAQFQASMAALQNQLRIAQLNQQTSRYSTNANLAHQKRVLAESQRHSTALESLSAHQNVINQQQANIAERRQTEQERYNAEEQRRKRAELLNQQRATQSTVALQGSQIVLNQAQTGNVRIQTQLAPYETVLRGISSAGQLARGLNVGGKRIGK